MIQKRIPSVRFIEYSDVWAKTKLNRIAEIIGGGTPDTKQLSYWNGGINWFSPTEVGKTVYLTKSEKTISQLGLQKSSAKLLPAFKTILFTSRAGIGDVGILTEESATNQGFQSLVVNERTDVYFLYSYSNKIKKYALKHSAGSTFLEISGKELGKMDLSIPSLQEQSAIGSLFRTLDDLLSSYKDNLANYQSLKATMLSKMFPKAGQTVPEIRLDGFEGEWKLYELKSRAETITKGTTPKDKNWQGEVNYIKTESINRDTGSLIRTASTSLEEHLGYLKRSKLKEGDVLFSIVGTLGVVGIVDKKDLPANTNQQIAIIRLKRDNAIFMLNFLKSPRIKSFIKSDSTIGAQPSLSLWQIEKIKVSLPPSLQEQQAIGSYFSNLDNLINSHQEKIFQLETLKKKLLQDMFI